MSAQAAEKQNTQQGQNAQAQGQQAQGAQNSQNAQGAMYKGGFPSPQAARPNPYQPSWPSAYGSQSPMQGNATSSGQKLLIGQGIRLSGQIESCNHLVIEGTVEATLKDANLMEISESGTFLGEVEISEATIAGSFEGSLTVNGRLTIKSGAHISGTITYKELSIEAGAVIDGALKSMDTKTKGTFMKAENTNQSAQGAKNAQKSADQKADKKAAQQQSGQSGDSQLPFTEKTSAAAE